MKIGLLGNLGAIHFLRWIHALKDRGHTIHVFSSHTPLASWLGEISYRRLPIAAPHGYFANAPFLRRQLARLQLDLLHVHFASGYGTLGSLTGFHPRLLSVWGSDVYQFPDRSLLHRLLLTQVLRSADHISATSHTMAERTRHFTTTPIDVVSFGVDTDQFHPRNLAKQDHELRIGTARTLKRRYGIDILLRAFALLTARGDSTRIRLVIAGDGPERIRLESLAEILGIRSAVEFGGRVPHAHMPQFLQSLDIFVAPSRYESFGVAVLEACACELPVVVSDVGGLPEVVLDGVTGLVVERENPAALADRLGRLVDSAELRRQLGSAGRSHVITNYQWEHSVDRMESLYQRLRPDRG